MAGAIVTVLQDEEKITPAPLSSFESITGKGIKVSYQGNTYWVGSHKLLKDFSATVSDVMADMLVHYESDGNGIIYFGRENELLAIIAVSDPIKATSAEAVKELKRQGIDICMLTGDGQRTALAVSSRLGIERFVADALPDDKAEFVRELQMQGKKVAMVGDGINDAPALVSADVGMAIGAGTDIAIESADIVLMKSDLLEAVTAVRLSKAVIRNIKENLFWALIYNSLGIPLAAGVFYSLLGWKLNPMFGAAAMSLSSVCVVLNALRLKLFRTEYEKSYKENKGENFMEKKLIIEGMSCSHCSGRVEAALNALDGVSAKVNLEEKTATVTLSQSISDEILIKSVTDAGYTVKEIR